jgi:acetylornithine/succinyldiaminopimelate/putrescine aminotransferase
MMAGFRHVPGDDIDALRDAVDDQCTAVLISPIQLGDAARPLSASYLEDVRQLCDEQDLLLIVDESRLVFGSTPSPFVFASIAEISADVVIIASGLFAGLPGGMVLAGDRACPRGLIDLGRFPLLAAVATETLAEMNERNLPAVAAAPMQNFATALAERIGTFEFVRDLHATGMTIGIETDIAAEELVRSGLQCGLLLEAAGETSIRIQPPIEMDPADREALLDRLGKMMEWIERRDAEFDFSGTDASVAARD